MVIQTALSYWIILLLAIAVLEWFFHDEQQRDSAIKRWPVNFALVAISVGIAAAAPISSIATSIWAVEHHVGILHLLGFSRFWAVLVSFLAVSLFDYLIHICAHRVPVLWQFHKIHHSDTEVDVTTTYRNHPVMMLLLSAVSVLFVLVLGLSTEALVFHAALVIVLDCWQHSAVRFSPNIERMARTFVITPHEHRVHHSDDYAESSSNFGADLVIWDRMFGTYLSAPLQSKSNFRYGLKEVPAEKADDLNAMLMAPFERHLNSQATDRAV